MRNWIWGWNLATALILLGAVIHGSPAIAQSGQTAGDSVALSIGIGDTIKGAPLLLIYVDGTLAGSVPGSVAIERRDDGVPIEIGMSPFTASPLYSFILGKDQIEQGAIDLVVTDMAGYASPGADFWHQFKFYENGRINRKLQILSPKSMAISLPPNPYLNIADLWQEQRITPFSSAWFGAEIEEIYPPTLQATKHYTAGSSSFGKWSGANVVRTGIDITPKTKWTIESDPSGAQVQNEIGEVGSTVINKQLATTQYSFFIMKKEGYIDTVYTCVGRAGCENHKLCKKRKMQSGLHLFCNLETE